MAQNRLSIRTVRLLPNAIACRANQQQSYYQQKIRAECKGLER